MDTWFVSRFLLLRFMNAVGKYCMFPFFLAICIGVELLGHTVVVCLTF